MKNRNDYLLKTAVACRVARLDRTRYNEALKAGALAFVPDGTPGKSRFFGEEAEIGLYIFARLVEQTMSVTRAGLIAEWVHDAIKRDDFDDDQVAVCYALNGSTYVVPGKKLARDGQTQTPQPWRVEVFDLGNIRGDLMNGVSYERRIVGGPDDE